jgi:hypothetical protein
MTPELLRLKAALGLREENGHLVAPPGSVVWWADRPRDFVLLADTLEDALAMATVIYETRGGRLSRRRQLPAALQMSSIAAAKPSTPPRYIAEALRGRAPEALVVVFSADETFAVTLEHAADAMPRVIAVPVGNYGTRLAELPAADRPECLAQDILSAFFASAREIIAELLGTEA